MNVQMYHCNNVNHSSITAVEHFVAIIIIIWLISSVKHADYDTLCNLPFY